MPGSPAVARQMRAIAKRMRSRGLTVLEMPGWENRGRSATFTPWAALCHHTAATVDADRVLRDGRSDLPGPLCNWACHRGGAWVMVAAGRANHAGVGTLPSSESYGIEATGPIPLDLTVYGPPAFPQYAAYVLGVACICEELHRRPAGTVYGHKETARPLGRKINPYFDMGAFRRSVAAALGGSPTPTPTPPPKKDWFDMATQKDLETAVRKEVRAALGLRDTDKDLVRTRYNPDSETFTELLGAFPTSGIRAVLDRLGRIEARLDALEPPPA